MSNSVQMPALGESVTEGTVTRWLKSVGDEIEVDEPLLEVSTDKVDTEIPSPYAGVLEKILADEDDVVEVGGDLAYIGDGSGSDSEEPAEEPAEEEESSDEDSSEAAEEPAAEETEESSSADDSEDEAPASSGSEGEGTEITMPALGESVTEGTVTRWLKEVGEEIEVDEPLLEVSTDKVDTEVPSPVAGIVQAHLAEEDETVDVGAPLARVGSGAPDSSDSADSADDSDADESAEEPAPVEEEESEAKAEEEKPEAKPEPTQTKPEPAEAAPEQKTAAPAPSKPAESKSESKSESSASAPAAAETVGENVAYVTPLVRRLARDQGVDLASVTGTGVGGRIRKQDVMAAAANRSSASTDAAAPAAGGPKAPFKFEIPEEAAKLRGTTEKASRIRQTIAKRMSESLDVSAQLTQVIEVDMTRVVKMRKANKEAFQSKHGSKLTYLPFFGKAIVEALMQHPKVNAQYDLESQQITYFDSEHLAIAVDTPRGLLVPVIKDAGELSIAGLSKAIDDVADRTRNNKIMPDELSGGTFTITNIGSVGALFDTPILNQPQMGILGTGTIVRRPVVVKTADGEESIAIRDMVYLPLTYNHQLVDGADAGRFLQTIKARLEEGNFEADLEL